MKLLRRQISNVAVALLCSAAALFASVYEVWSQTGRIVKVVVAAPPGGASDILARLLPSKSAVRVR